MKPKPLWVVLCADGGTHEVEAFAGMGMATRQARSLDRENEDNGPHRAVRYVPAERSRARWVAPGNRATVLDALRQARDYLSGQPEPFEATLAKLNGAIALLETPQPKKGA